MPELRIDLNADLGEGMPWDRALLQCVTSANIACGYHAGDAVTMMETVTEALAHGVQIGAHLSLPDREHFGRWELHLPPQHIFADCLYQIGALRELCQALGAVLVYVKPHGALYNMACRDEAVALPVVQACQKASLAVMGLPHSALAKVAERMGVPFIGEGFVDRRYGPDGHLLPRSLPGAVLESPEEAATQALSLARSGTVRSLCIHGDHPQAVAIAQEVRKRLESEAGIVVRAFDLPAGVLSRIATESGHRS